MCFEWVTFGFDSWKLFSHWLDSGNFTFSFLNLSIDYLIIFLAYILLIYLNIFTEEKAFRADFLIKILPSIMIKSRCVTDFNYDSNLWQLISSVWIYNANLLSNILPFRVVLTVNWGHFLRNEIFLCIDSDVNFYGFTARNKSRARHLNLKVSIIKEQIFSFFPVNIDHNIYEIFE